MGKVRYESPRRTSATGLAPHPINVDPRWYAIFRAYGYIGSRASHLSVCRLR